MITPRLAPVSILASSAQGRRSPSTFDDPGQVRVRVSLPSGDDRHHRRPGCRRQGPRRHPSCLHPGGRRMPIRIADFAFQTPQLNVAEGTTVAWTNDGPSPHSVTAVDGDFDAGVLDVGSTFTHTLRCSRARSRMSVCSTPTCTARSSSGMAWQPRRQRHRHRPLPRWCRLDPLWPRRSSTSRSNRPRSRSPPAPPSGWTNTGEYPHTVSADDGTFDSEDPAARHDLLRDHDPGRHLPLPLQRAQGHDGHDRRHLAATCAPPPTRTRERVMRGVSDTPPMRARPLTELEAGLPDVQMAPRGHRSRRAHRTAPGQR